jgi:GDP-4-dehydro-6-deoxy-D-mannose reductase
MSTVLLTGANGFVGKHLYDELVRSGFEVVRVGGTHSSASEFALDLTKKGEAEKIDFKGVSGVVHLAGLAAVGPSFTDPMHYINTNIGIEVNLFEAALKANASARFVVISTGALYDPTSGLPLHESSPLQPNSPYAVSKIGQEEMALYYEKRGFEVIIARPFNHIGPGQNEGFIVPDLTKQIVACEKGTQSDVNVGNLAAKRDYTDVRDIARAYRLLLEKGKSGEVYNVCSGKALSGHEILEQICSLTTVSPKVVQDPTKMRPADNPIIYGDHSKLTQATGWQPEITLEKTLADVVADWRDRD